MTEKQSLSNNVLRSDSTLENFRRLDVYPTAQRICISTYHQSPEKNSPRHLRKQIYISEEKIRNSTSRSSSFGEYSPSSGYSSISRSFSGCDTPETPLSSEERVIAEHFLAKSKEHSMGRSESPSTASIRLERLEILSRTPVRALRCNAGIDACMLTGPDGTDFQGVDTAAINGLVHLLRTADKVANRPSGRSRSSSTVTSTLSSFNSDTSLDTP